jgi:hypothetical protein
MAVGDVYRVATHFNSGSELTMCVMHHEETVACTDALPGLSLLNSIYPVWESFYEDAIISQESQITLFNCQRIKPTAGVPVTAIVGSTAFPAIVGTGAADPVPSTSAALLSFYTALNTRNGRGRIYIPGLSVLAQNDGQLVAGALAVVQGFGDNWCFDIPAVGADTGEWRVSVFSRALGTAAQAINAVAHSNMASQRGRRNHPGLGT